MIEIVFEEDRNRVVAYDGALEAGELTFRRNEEFWTLDHTYVDRQYRGQEIAQKMMKLVVEEAKNADTKILPRCSFAQKECDLNEEYQELVFRWD